VLSESKKKQPAWPGLSWNDDDPAASIGPGQSRPLPGVRTKMYRMVVKPINGPKIVVQLPAESKKRAQVYAENRWPGSTVSSVSLVTQ